MIAKDIVYEMSSKIGEHLLYNQLNAYDSRSITSAYNWILDELSVTSAHWNGRGKIRFTAKASFCGDHPWGKDESLFGADKVRVKIEGLLNDPNENYLFEIESIELVSGEANDLSDDEFEVLH